MNQAINLKNPPSAVVTDHLDIWTSAIKNKSSAGRGGGSKRELYGIKKLRELILDLAVRGLLVPQDPSDEPASELLKRIAAEKAKLVKTGKIKKQKLPLPLAEEEKPFELPEDWVWEKLGNLAIQITDGVHHTPTYVENGVPFISVKDIDGTTISFRNCKYISQEQHFEINQRCNPVRGDLLICRIGTLGRATIVDTDQPFSLFVSVGLIKFLQRYYIPSFAHLVLHSPVLTKQYEDIKAGGSHTNKLNLGDLPRLAMPVAPLDEQHRIVAKVDELMALCDQLEQQTEASLTAHETLVETLLAALTSAQNHDSFQQAWQSIAQQFDTLFTTEHSIDQVKQAILQLAVMGKLVPQDPNDEPASEFLKKIAAEKARLVKEGKIKKQKPLPPISDKEKTFDLPRGWTWVHLRQISIQIGTGPFGSMIHKSDYVFGGTPLINPSHMQNDMIVEDPNVSVSLKKSKELSSYFLTQDDIVLARRGEVGRCALVTQRESGWLCGTGSFYLRLSKDVSRKFMTLIFKVGTTRSYLAGEAVGTTMVNLNHGILNKLPIALPPLEEQFRIVDRVEELMELCDQLKANLTDAKTIQLHLADAIAEQAVG